VDDQDPLSPDVSPDVPDAATTQSPHATEVEATTPEASTDDDVSTADEVSAEGAIASAHPVLVYTGLRLAVLAVVGGILWLLGLRDVYLILLAFLISGVISAVALSRRREGAAYGITRAVRSVNARIDASSRAEDLDDSADFDAPKAPPSDQVG
jgi:hypothetical protein